MADTGIKLVLLAGGLTLGNEWYQTHEINWRIPVAAALAAAGTGALGRVSPRGATGVGIMALIVASTTRLNGKSPVEQLSTIVNASPVKAKVTRTKVQG